MEKAYSKFNPIKIENIFKSISDKVAQGQIKTNEELFSQFLAHQKIQTNNSRQINKALINQIIIARDMNLIDDVVFRIIEINIDAKFPIYFQNHSSHKNYQKLLRQKRKSLEAPIELNDYCTKKQYFHKMTSHLDLRGQSPLTQRYFKSLSFNKIKRISARERIFYKYSIEEMQLMASLVEKTLRINFAQSSKIVIHFNDTEQMELEIGPTDQYRLALKIFHKEKERAILSGKLPKEDIKNLDLLASAVEFGIVSKEEIKIILETEGFLRPEISIWKKIGKLFSALGKVAIITSPATQGYGLIAVWLWEELENKDVKTDTTTHLF